MVCSVSLELTAGRTVRRPAILLANKNIFCVEALQAKCVELVRLSSSVIVDAALQIHIHVCIWLALLLCIPSPARAALATPALSMLVLGVFRFGIGTHAFGTKG